MEFQDFVEKNIREVMEGTGFSFDEMLKGFSYSGAYNKAFKEAKQIDEGRLRAFYENLWEKFCKQEGIAVGPLPDFVPMPLPKIVPEK